MVIEVSLPTPRHGVRWGYCAGRGATVGMVVVHQLPCVWWAWRSLCPSSVKPGGRRINNAGAGDRFGLMVSPLRHGCVDLSGSAKLGGLA